MQIKMKNIISIAMLLLMSLPIFSEGSNFSVAVHIENFTDRPFVIRVRDESSGRDFYLEEVGKISQKTISVTDKMKKGGLYSLFVFGEEEKFHFNNIRIPIEWESDSFTIEWHLTDRSVTVPEIAEISFTNSSDGEKKTIRQESSEKLDNMDILSPVVIEFDSLMNNDISLVAMKMFDSEGRNVGADVTAEIIEGRSVFTMDVSNCHLAPASEYSVRLSGMRTISGEILDDKLIPIKTAGGYGLTSVSPDEIFMTIENGKLQMKWRMNPLSVRDTLKVLTKRGWETPSHYGYASIQNGFCSFNDFNWYEGFYQIKIISEDASENKAETTPLVYLDDNWNISKKETCESITITADSKAVKNAIRYGTRFFIEDENGTKKEISEQTDFSAVFSAESKFPGKSERYKISAVFPEGTIPLPATESEKSEKIAYLSNDEYKKYFLEKSDIRFAEAEECISAVQIPNFSGSIDSAHEKFSEANSQIEKAQNVVFPNLKNAASYKKDSDFQSKEFRLRLSADKKKTELLEAFIAKLAEDAKNEKKISESYSELKKLSENPEYKRIITAEKSLQKNADFIKKADEKQKKKTKQYPRVIDAFGGGYEYVSDAIDRSESSVWIQAFSLNRDHFFIDWLNVVLKPDLLCATVDFGLTFHIGPVFPFGKLGMGIYFSDEDSDETPIGFLGKGGVGFDIKLTNHMKLTAEYNMNMLVGQKYPAMDGFKVGMTFGWLR